MVSKFQLEIAEKARKMKKCILELDCRMGKSRIALLATEGMYPFVVCPPSLKLTWEKEIRHIYSKTKIPIIKTTEKTKFNKYNPKAVIVDEAHGLKYKTSRELLNFCKKADYLIFLTATALINRPVDYYWLTKLCNAHSMRYRDFAIKFNSAQIGYKNQIMLGEPSNLEELVKIKNKVSITRRRNLKIKKIEVNLPNSINIEQVSFENYANLQKLIALKKADDPKILSAIMKIFRKHHKILYLYTHKIIRDVFCKSEKYIDGSVPFRNRQAKINKFLASKERDHLFLNYKSCGVGLDIPADAVCFIERTWSKALDYQAYMRAYGFERDEPLHVYFLNLKDEKKIKVSALKTEQNKGLIINH